MHTLLCLMLKYVKYYLCLLNKFSLSVSDLLTFWNNIKKFSIFLCIDSVDSIQLMLTNDDTHTCKSRKQRKLSRIYCLNVKYRVVTGCNLYKFILSGYFGYNNSQWMARSVEIYRQTENVIPSNELLPVHDNQFYDFTQDRSRL